MSSDRDSQAAFLMQQKQLTDELQRLEIQIAKLQKQRDIVFDKATAHAKTYLNEVGHPLGFFDDVFVSIGTGCYRTIIEKTEQFLRFAPVEILIVEEES